MILHEAYGALLEGRRKSQGASEEDLDGATYPHDLHPFSRCSPPANPEAEGLVSFSPLTSEQPKQMSKKPAFICEIGGAPEERRRRRVEKRSSKRVFLGSPFLLCPLKVFTCFKSKP